MFWLFCDFFSVLCLSVPKSEASESTIFLVLFPARLKVNTGKKVKCKL